MLFATCMKNSGKSVLMGVSEGCWSGSEALAFSYLQCRYKMVSDHCSLALAVIEMFA